MDDALEAIREVVKTPASNGKKLDELVSYIQSKRGTPGLSITAVFFGIAKGIEKIAEHRIYFGGGDAKLDEINKKIEAIDDQYIFRNIAEAFFQKTEKSCVLGR
jgi:hypothetical protein